ncbi:polyprenyl synthetase family protein [Streptomyces heilongjiangensis]|uniref:Polyprenyl synthetase family protein n=1 Tax=Streptomyces heilongjiangensis TaxID=945052 RepID=A0ABW1BK32_9ACTN|nr:polyprenyl synthetase family protein [Streptomyces heilongjiangensis]MDC2952120.1 polyprenyl synthetase family protein [Streptomyces heilongjiangensis]
MKIPEILGEVRALVTPAMEESLSRLSPEIRRVIDYHMGWRDAEGRPVQRRGSKSVRPALAFLSAKAGGGEVKDAVPGALAVEFLNNWAFLIDDVMDGDRFRRQRETAWVVFGQGQAICAGTALLTLAQQVLLESPSADRLAALSLTMDTSARMLAGQTLDMTFEQRFDYSVDESMTMTQSKTASLMRCATSIGAILVGADDTVVDALADFGQSVGVAFQARDDMLGIWGTPDQTGGRPRGFDVKARKGTLPMAVALNDAIHGEELRKIFGQEGELAVPDVERATQLIDAAGGRQWTEDLARRMVERANTALARLTLEDDVRGHLGELAAMGLPDDVSR